MSYNRILAERGEKRFQLMIWLFVLLIQILAFIGFCIYVR